MPLAKGRHECNADPPIYGVWPVFARWVRGLPNRGDVLASSSGRSRFIAVTTLVLAAALGATGCATVTRGAKESFTVQTVPSGAVVRLSTGQTGFSPVTFRVTRKEDFVVVVSMEGHETAEVIMKASVAGGGAVGFVGNAIIGGVIGGAMDIGTGATMSHSPNPLIVKLAPKTPPAEAPPKPSPEAE